MPPIAWVYGIAKQGDVPDVPDVPHPGEDIGNDESGADADAASENAPAIAEHGEHAEHVPVATGGPVPGLAVIPDVVPAALQAQVIAQIEAAMAAGDKSQVTALKTRTQVAFGANFHLTTRALSPAPPLTGALARLAEVVQRITGQAPSSALVHVYDGPNAGLPWHVDAPAYGLVIAGVSLGEGWPLVFSNEAGDKVEVAALVRVR